MLQPHYHRPISNNVLQQGLTIHQQGRLLFDPLNFCFTSLVGTRNDMVVLLHFQMKSISYLVFTGLSPSYNPRENVKEVSE